MGQKQLKKIRRVHRLITQEIEPILPQILRELDHNQEKFDRWFQMAVFLKMQASEIPLSEYMPAKLGFPVRPPIFNPKAEDE